MRIDDVRRCGFRQQKPDRGCVWPIERNQVRAGLSDHPGKQRLPRRVTNGLSQCGRRQGNADAKFGCACQERHMRLQSRLQRIGETR